MSLDAIRWIAPTYVDTGYEGWIHEGYAEIPITRQRARNWEKLMDQARMVSQQLDGVGLEHLQAHPDNPAPTWYESYSQQAYQSDAVHELMEYAFDGGCVVEMGPHLQELIKEETPRSVEQVTCQITPRRIEWLGRTDSRNQTRIKTGALTRETLLRFRLYAGSREEVQNSFRRLVEISSYRALQILENGLQPLRQESPHRDIAPLLCPKDLIGLLKELDPDQRRRALRKLPEIPDELQPRETPSQSR